LNKKEVIFVLIFNCCYFAETSATTNKRKIYNASFVDSLTYKQYVFTVDSFLLWPQKRTKRVIAPMNKQICFTVSVKVQKFV